MFPVVNGIPCKLICCSWVCAFDSVASRGMDVNDGYCEEATSSTPVIRSPEMMISEARSAMHMVGILVLPEQTSGIILASTTRKLLIPLTRQSGATTVVASSKRPILHVLVG